jgi:hypothetical protein
MPFKSKAQRAWMYVKHPKMARQWEKETPKGEASAGEEEEVSNGY